MSMPWTWTGDWGLATRKNASSPQSLAASLKLERHRSKMPLGEAHRLVQRVRACVVPRHFECRDNGTERTLSFEVPQKRFRDTASAKFLVDEQLVEQQHDPAPFVAPVRRQQRVTVEDVVVC